MEVRASAGDTRLGGEDFSRVIATLFAKQCEGLSTEERQAWLESEPWWRVTEQAKRDLASRPPPIPPEPCGKRTGPRWASPPTTELAAIKKRPVTPSRSAA